MLIISEAKIGKGFSQLNARILKFFSFGFYIKSGTKYEIVYSKDFGHFVFTFKEMVFLTLLQSFNNGFMAFGNVQNKYVLAGFILNHLFCYNKFLTLPDVCRFINDVASWLKKKCILLLSHHSFDL